MKIKFWKNKSIKFTVEGRPPRKSMWGKEDAKLIFRLREEALQSLGIYNK